MNVVAVVHVHVHIDAVDAVDAVANVAAAVDDVGGMIIRHFLV